MPDKNRKAVTNYYQGNRTDASENTHKIFFSVSSTFHFLIYLLNKNKTHLNLNKFLIFFFKNNIFERQKIIGVTPERWSVNKKVNTFKAYFL